MVSLSLISLFSEIFSLVFYSLRGFGFIAEMVLRNPVSLNETKKASA